MSNTKQTFAQPLVSIDVVPVWVEDGQAQFGLGVRKYEPFKGVLALPGVLMGHERSGEAAARALSTKVGIEPSGVLAVRDVGVFDSAERDPRGPTMSIAKVAVLATTAAAAAVEQGTMTAHLLAEAQVDSLPFDHARIAVEARKTLAAALWSDPAVLRALLGDGFSTSEAVALESGLTGGGADLSNMRRRLAAVPGLLSGPGVRGKTGRPSTSWLWDD